MSQNGRTYFKNLAANTYPLSIKGVKPKTNTPLSHSYRLPPLKVFHVFLLLTKRKITFQQNKTKLLLPRKQILLREKHLLEKKNKIK